MPTKLHRYYGAGYLHFITTSCYQRSPLLSSPRDRDLFLEILEQVRRRFHFVVVGYVVMPEHVHLLLSEPQRDSSSVVMAALKQSFARRLLQNRRSRADQCGLWSGPLREVTSGSPAFTTSWSSPKRSESRNYGTCIATP